MDEKTRHALAASLGLPEDATKEQIAARVNELSASATEGEGEPDPAAKPAEGEPAPEDNPMGDPATKGEPSGTDEGEPAATPAGGEQSNASGTVTLDTATFERLKAGSDAALEAQANQKKRDIIELVSAKIKDGTIPPARREHWTTAAAADYAGTKAVLDGMKPGLIPVEERGSAGGDTEGIQTGSAQGLPEDWFPEIKTIRAQAEKARPVVHAKEG